MAAVTPMTPGRMGLLLAAYRTPGITLVGYLDTKPSASYTSLRRHAARLRASGLLAPPLCRWQESDWHLRLRPGWEARVKARIDAESDPGKRWPQWGLLSAMTTLHAAARNKPENADIYGVVVTRDEFLTVAHKLGWSEIASDSAVYRLRQHLMSIEAGYAWDALVLTTEGLARAKQFDDVQRLSEE